MKNIRIGTMIDGHRAVHLINELGQHGFESYALGFNHSILEQDIAEEAKKILDVAAKYNAEISCISVYGNPLGYDEESQKTKEVWELLIKSTKYFNTDLVTGFTGRLPGSIDKSIPRYKEIFSDLSKLAEDNGVKLAFENCSMGGDWNDGAFNIAHGPDAWELMFDALPADNIGLEWEPCHQMVNLIDPIPQLREWAAKGKIFHLHGKDATIAWDIVKKHGIQGPHAFAWHRTPGFGDSNWADIITILRQNNYQGNIDIEGFHDPVYNGDYEVSAQVVALNYLKTCRGGELDPLPNPFR